MFAQPVLCPFPALLADCTSSALALKAGYLGLIVPPMSYRS